MSENCPECGAFMKEAMTALTVDRSCEAKLYACNNCGETKTVERERELDVPEPPEAPESMKNVHWLSFLVAVVLRFWEKFIKDKG